MLLVSVFRPALLFSVFRVVGAIEKASLEQLYSDDSEDEVEEHVDDHDVEDILERVDDAVKHSLTITARNDQSFTSRLHQAISIV